MPLINCENNLQLKLSAKCILIALKVFFSAANQVLNFAIYDTKLYVPVVTLSTQNNLKLLKQLESEFKRTIKWNKHRSKKKNQAEKKYQDFLIDPSFQGVNRLSVLSFKD